MPPAPLPPELERFLAKPRPAVVATIGRDGRPVSVATWYGWFDGRILLAMEPTSYRIGNLRRDPRVSLTVLGDSWYSHVSLLGRVVEFCDEPGFDDIDRLSMHYLGEPYEHRDAPCVSVLVEVERWHTYGDPVARDG